MRQAVSRAQDSSGERLPRRAAGLRGVQPLDWPGEGPLRVSPRRAAPGSGVKRRSASSDKPSTREGSRRRIAELQQALLVDPLTHLANRRYADIQLAARLNELRRYGAAFGVLFFDIDHFKDFNDRHGHPVGDRVLVRVASVASRSVRSMDTVCRWAGDEFLALIGHVDREQLTRVAEKVRLRVAKSAVRVGHAALPVTLSVGAAVADADESAPELLARVDRLMYRSKELGGNRVTVGTAAERQSQPEKPLRPGSRRVVRVLLVDDHAVVRQGLVAFLKNESELRVVGEAASGAEAIEIAGRLAPDVVLMDVTMTGMDGVEATRVIKQRQPAVRVIALSALTDADVTRRMAAAGASLFVSKAASPHELLRAIRSVRD